MNSTHRNEVHLAGTLVRDPELRYTPDGKSVASFTVATTYEKWTEYHRCVAWEKQAGRLGEHFKKDSFIELKGRLRTRKWEKDGQKRYTTEVVIWSLSDGTIAKNAHGVEVSDADLPF